MTQAQHDVYLCGLVPEDNEPVFVAQHLSPYAFMRPQVAGGRVLEVGFGSGYGAAYLAEAAAAVVGVDIAPGNPARAQARYGRPSVTFQAFDGAHLPFPDEAFDAAGSFQVIEHVPEPQLAAWLAEIRRVLRPGGRFFVSTLNLEHNQKPGRPYEKFPYHEKEFTAPELAALLQRAFPSVAMYGVHPTWRHRGWRRLKKWGFNADRFYRQATTADFVVSRRAVRRAMDLLAVCESPAW
ncbi:MAG: methyltransferase domain-containing protein [Candidatus Omnitrophica bacterium]|nr:methyltransferase domain-containing protein [Candidatus Omnitrophota bacterium]